MPAANAPKHGAWRLFERFRRDRDGAVAVYSAIAIAVLVGFSGLVIDVSRVTTTETQLQYGADAAALAGAAELDGGTINGRNAIVRATEAARTAFVQNIQTHATGVSDIDIPEQDIRFLSALDPDVYTTDHTAARFIEVTTEARTVNNMLIQVVGGSDTSQLRARAVAGFTQAICRSTPLMMCNPQETATNKDFDADAMAGDMIILKQQGGGNSQWAPGNFGLLQAQSGPGASNLKAEIATPNPTSCYGDHVDLHTGSINSIEEAFNVRFDIYPNGGEFSNKSAFPPARNVVKGDEWNLQGSQQPDPNTFQKLPRDECLTGGSCGTNNPTRIGNGNFSWNDYLQVNHPGWGGAIPSELGTNPTRYQMYRYELEESAIPDNSEETPPGEDGNPTNYMTNNDPPPDGCPNIFNGACPNDISEVDRRRLVMAVINCTEQGINGSQTNVPVVDFVDLFMTEPMDKGADQELAVEVIGSAGKSNYGIQGTMRDIVQLYR